jgi:3-phenylpropionate/cinnamic acid dioxygenase small subunit
MMDVDTFHRIQDLVIGYCAAHDAQDADAAASCFSAGASYLGSGPGPVALREGFSRVYSTRAAQRRHVLTNFRIRETAPGAASVVAIEQLYTIIDGRAELTLVGRYVVDVVLEGGEWKIERLEPRMDVPYETADTPQLSCQHVTRDGDEYYVLVPTGAA